MNNIEEKQIISNNISMRITSLRFLLAILVVFIHNNLTADIAINYYYLDFNEPIIVTIIKQFICEVLGNAAVPLFFMFAGYLQFVKKYTYIQVLKKKVRSLLIPYVSWTMISVLVYFIIQSIPSLKSFFQNKNNIVSNWDVNDWINILWAHDIDKHPLVAQFWFIRNLMVLVLISPILTLFAKKCPFCFIIISFLYFINGLPLSFGITLFFYMIGYYFAEYNVDFFSFADRISWLDFLILFIVEMVILILCNENFICFDIFKIVSCLFFLKLSASIIKNEKLYNISRYLAGFSFFLYAIHAPLLINFLNKISYRIIPLTGIWCLVQFIIPCFLCIIIGTGIGIILSKICPPLFRVLNGGR